MVHLVERIAAQAAPVFGAKKRSPQTGGLDKMNGASVQSLWDRWFAGPFCQGRIAVISAKWGWPGREVLTGGADPSSGPLRMVS
jgi:hypothetical protein